MTEFGRIPKELVEKAWPACAPFLEKSFVYAFRSHGADDLKAWCLRDECQLWAAAAGGAVCGAMVTTLMREPKAKSCVILNLGGKDIRRWLPKLRTELRAFAEENGCDAVVAVGREGFSRLAPDFAEQGRLYVISLKD